MPLACCAQKDVTCEVSKFERSSPRSDAQPLNMTLMSVTFEVSKDEMSSEAKDVQP